MNVVWHHFTIMLGELILDGIIWGGKYIVGDEKYTKWPTLYGDMWPPGITFCHTIVRTHDPGPGEVGGNMIGIMPGELIENFSVSIFLLAY